VPPPTQSTRTTAIEISVIGSARDFFFGGGIGWPYTGGPGCWP
jgi:hypothetical protein